jgi:Zn/Cd-binding protein ZinT
MHTNFFYNVLDGLKEEDRHNRLQTKANHMAWLTGSIVQDRVEIATMLGNPQKQAADHLFSNNKGIQDKVEYPTLESFKEEWQRLTPLLRETFMQVSDEKLDEQFEMMPGMQMTYYEMITFIIYREANIIGQLALWRRLLNYPGMKYM